MLSFPRLINRFKNQKRSKQLIIVAASLTVLGSVFFGLLIILTWTGAFGVLPDREELRKIENPVATEVYSADSVLLGRYYIQERSDVQYDEFPVHLVDALITTEDVRFYDHSAVDVKSLFRVFIKSILLSKESSGGGSTLTQQLAKNLYPRKNYWLFSLPINKTREIIIASRLEHTYSKDELLTLYLNTVPFGDNAYGIEAAAQRFYSKTVTALSVDEAATLIGMLKATYVYNPRVFPERAKQRRNVVMNQMYKYGKLSIDQLNTLLELPIALQYKKITHHSGLAPYFREYIRQELLEWCKQHQKPDGEKYNLYTDGLKVFTTIDSRLQLYAEQAVKMQMAIIQKRFDEHWAKTKPWDAHPAILEDAIKKSERMEALRAKGLPAKEIDELMETPVAVSVFTWQGEKEMRLSTLDSIKHYLTFLNAGVLAVDPTQGAIKVWVGGIDHHYFQFDHVKQSTQRQVGSTFKPIVYAAALEQGMRPCEFTSAEKVSYTNMEEWAPENSDEEYYDLKFSMEGALTYSVNTVSVKVLEKAGIDQTISLAQRMGITSKMPSVPSLALGTANISMSELVNAYACFANKGLAVKPFYITSIHDSRDSLLEAFYPATEQRALSEETAATIVHMLKRVINEGTGAGLRSRYGITNDLAGKTGTTQSNADGWFISMSPSLVVGAWVGADDPRVRFRSTALGQGARTALPIVGSFYQQVNADKTFRSISSQRFDELPDKLKRRLSCDLYKVDKTIIEKIFGKKKRENKQLFGEEEKQGLFKKLFRKNR
jgi:penicillin-binding protein 1A